MFEKIKRWWSKIFSKNEIYNKLNITDLRNTKELNALNEWYYLYINKPTYLDNCKEKENAITETLNLGYCICNKMTDLILLEFQSSVNNDEEVSEIYKRFIDKKLNITVERCLAFGSVILKPYFDSNLNMQIDINSPFDFIPLRIENDNLVDCAFVHSYTVSKGNIETYYTLIEKHLLKDDYVEISHKVFKSENSSVLGNSINLLETKWGDREEIRTIASNKPLFVYYKTNCTNNINLDSQIGISFFANAFNNIRQADKIESALSYEIDSAERKTVMQMTTLKQNGIDNTYTRSRRYIGSLSEESLQGDITPTMRISEHIEAKNNKLIDIENNLQVSRGTFSEMLYESKTATEILVTKEQTFNVVKRYQDDLQITLIELLEVIQNWKKLILGTNETELDVEFNFYDSILAETDINDDLLLVQNGLMPMYRLLMQRRGLTEDEAKRWIAEAKEVGE